MNSILVIHPYFGKLPELFPFWLESCKLNSSVNFLIVTDQAIVSNSSNIMVVKSSLAEIKSSIEKIIKTKIWLEKPYKLCDFRPLFGQIFNRNTSKYDFWGYCDCDLVFGDIRHFLTDEVLDNHDYILGWGHFHIQRTEDHKFEHVWKSARGLWKDICWQEVFASNQNEWFDELPYGVAGRYYELYPERCWLGYSDNQACFESPALSQLPFMSLFNNYGLWKKWEGFQHHLERLPFLKREQGNDLKHIIYQKKGVKLFSVGINELGEIEEREILYTHFYKRILSINTFNLQNYIIRPNSIMNTCRLNKMSLLFYAHHYSIYYNYIRYRINRKIGTLIQKFYHTYNML